MIESYLCRNATDVAIDSKLLQNRWTREFATFVIVLLLFGMSLGVALILVPLAVYSQLVYSGVWHLLTCRQRLWCMITGNYDAVRQAKPKAEVHRKLMRQRSRLTPDQETGCCIALAGSQAMGPGSWCHMSHSWGRYVLKQKPCNPQEEDPLTTSHRGQEAEPGSEEARANEDLTGLKKWMFILLIMPFILVFNTLRFEIVFDLIPIRCDTRNVRKCVKILRLVCALYCLGFLLTYVPVRSAASLRDTLQCVLASCKHSNWRPTAETLDCESAQSVGLVQPSFWSDLVDIVQASLTLAILTLISEWRDTIEGKNRLGSKLLKKVDLAWKQRYYEDNGYTTLPRGRPAGLPQRKRLILRDSSDNKQEMARLARLRDHSPERSEDAKQADRVAAVNTGAAGSKLTMAQLYSGVASIVAIIAGARRYNSQCVSNVILWENMTTPESRGDRTWASLLAGTLETVDSSLRLLLMKPERQPIVTWTSIFRATMSNLTLVTVGIAFKNFITRTSAAKADVAAMLAKRDKTHKEVDTVHLLLAAFVSGWLVIKKAALKGVAKLNCSGRKNSVDTSKVHVVIEGQPQASSSNDEEVDLEVLAARVEGLTDRAAKQNARSILKVYKYSTIAILIIAFWYACVVLISFGFASFAWVESMVPAGIAFLTLVPLLDFVANALRRGMDEEDVRKIDASMYVVKGMILLRSCLILSQGAMLRSIYGRAEAERMTWESYWSNGDASEKLAAMFSFDVGAPELSLGALVCTRDALSHGVPPFITRSPHALRIHFQFRHQYLAKDIVLCCSWDRAGGSIRRELAKDFHYSSLPQRLLSAMFDVYLSSLKEIGKTGCKAQGSGYGHRR